MATQTLPSHTRQWVLANHPAGTPILTGPNPTFRLETAALPLPLKPNHLLLRPLYFSNDPAQRGWISPHRNPDRLYVPPVALDSPMRSGAIAEIVESTVEEEGFEKGGLVSTFEGSWSEWLVLGREQVQRVPSVEGIGASTWLGALGGPGLTAWYGTKIVAETKKEDIFVVSGAAGATGSMCVQIAKNIIGCRKVIGIAGSPEKCRWVESLGADACVDYKSPTFKKDFLAATDNEYVNVYFDNVGGEILDFMLSRMAREGRVACCGAISSYNTGITKLRSWGEIISMRLKLKGFIVLDWVKEGRAGESVAELAKAAKEGRIRIGEENETVVETGFEDVPGTWLKLFEGANRGKLVTKLAKL
ncbi:NAD(P)-binding protein [Saccharata proteae CBS 121410]|uniref:NAD(P)-binding protein n=1 Tax=Saccharata proteae CBS 121410 TaxID=1314787 RepID=A0A9P4I0D0_9PEZI|nr:NAD(P)-binding protein [Saccharata proteae CBS 121410]